MKQDVRDIRFGRRGGHWIEDGRAFVDFDAAPRCDLCGQPMVVGQQDRHYVCAELAADRSA